MGRVGRTSFHAIYTHLSVRCEGDGEERRVINLKRQTRAPCDIEWSSVRDHEGAEDGKEALEAPLDLGILMAR